MTLRIRRMRVNQNPDFFDKNLSHVILTVKKDSEKSVLFAVGGLRGLGAKREEKIEFVMEFEIQFFSVAERPLTFFLPTFLMLRK